MQLLSTQTVPSAAIASQPLDSGSSTGSSSDSSSASITSNDFLQLLVTEMKHQDPTADTDPNEYINQLVQVNSLQQLIQINQDLSGSSSSTAGSDSGASSSVTHAAALRTDATSAHVPPASGSEVSVAAAKRVASALSGSMQPPSIQPAVNVEGSSPGSVTGTLRHISQLTRKNHLNPVR